MAKANNPSQEEFSVSGEELLDTIKKLVREGNARRIMIQNANGTTMLEIPLTVGVVGAALLPVWAAVGALAALMTKCRIVVVRRD